MQHLIITYNGIFLADLVTFERFQAEIVFKFVLKS